VPPHVRNIDIAKQWPDITRERKLGHNVIPIGNSECEICKSITSSTPLASKIGKIGPKILSESQESPKTLKSPGSKFPKEDNHGTRLGSVNGASNRLCDLPRDDVVTGIANRELCQCSGSWRRHSRAAYFEWVL
jgi:hypothetical protein